VTILLLRHGETKWNLERRYQGRFDSPLTERGMDQARTIGGRLAALPEAASAPIVASPQGRARRTAEIIRERLTAPGELRLDDRLCELSLGSWDGLTFDDIARRSPCIFEGDGRYEWYFRSPDGESYEAFVGRVGDWLRELDQPSSIIVIVHGLVSRVLRGLYAGLPRAIALTLPVSQDRIFLLSAGAIEELRVQRDPTEEAGRG
jgi:broad specificity phosphatase PhoE